MNIEPTRSDMINKIKLVIDGVESRSEVARWAFAIYEDDDLRIADKVVLKYLELLGALDLHGVDREYLYTEEDLNHWLNSIKTEDIP
ncbi:MULTISPECIES: hypothetical protein [Pseudomonas]|nr:MULTISPECIES: hypothetical protein [Pseudomonas]AGZ33864.1 hypothetical protein PVLB_05285 [Pseudomonas sp. VLB120]MDT8925624.1 hypothetical protein [Pseudomonas taiwanensis]WEZ89696.1 hypothetical protein P3R38_05265 [Pseudomonas sp. NyZ480]WEZ90873.1 hypothetical protein P3R38_11565 [Pseudomonas sp. NyZ480]